jgi:hypothetical protein
VEGLSIEVVRGAAETVPGGEGMVFFPMTEVVEGKFSGGRQFRPTVGGESNVGKQENGNEVILSCLHSVLSFVGPMDEGGERAGREEGDAGCETRRLVQRKFSCLRQGK